MEILILITAMIVVGLIMGWVAGLIWKDMPLSTTNVYVIAIVTAIITGLLDWYVIPAMGFSDTLKIFGVIAEPPLAVLAVLWIIRRARS
ncbi:MAG: hypothetical protein DWQ07_07200 [Chloroflexi bacterium]|nr:MAG: hypothetical protein DWQ07_07200 [Chloroflexota bacterium]MBL1195511.1 hypothetical protein [Chloroflexota bacterium]NOH12793.1 hypothetical protein [Chloroflexota bacterium]